MKSNQEIADGINREMDDWINEQKANGNWPSCDGQAHYASLVVKALASKDAEKREAVAQTWEEASRIADASYRHWAPMRSMTATNRADEASDLAKKYHDRAAELRKGEANDQT